MLHDAKPPPPPGAVRNSSPILSPALSPPPPPPHRLTCIFVTPSGIKKLYDPGTEYEKAVLQNVEAVAIDHVALGQLMH